MVDRIGPGPLVPVSRPRPISGDQEPRKKPEEEEQPEEQEEPLPGEHHKGVMVDERA